MKHAVVQSAPAQGRHGLDPHTFSPYTKDLKMTTRQQSDDHQPYWGVDKR